MATETMFASPTITQHLIRGLAGIGALWAALEIAPFHPWSSLCLGVAMLVAFRGCPICWSIGLAETVHRRLTSRREPQL